MMYRTQKRTHSSLFPSVVYGLAGGAAWAWHVEDTSGGIDIFSFGATLILPGNAAVTWWAWMFDVFAAAMKTLRKPDAVSDDVRMLEAIARMTPEQAAVAYTWMGYSADPPPEPEPVIETAEGKFSKSFAISQTDKAAANSGYLKPVREFSDGTPQRRQMELLAKWLVSEGLAEPAAGPKPTRVIDPQAARRRILE